MIPYERETSTRSAKKRLYEAFSELDLPLPHLLKLASGSVVLAVDKETKANAQGAGKGQNPELGALAECFEHTVYENFQSPISQKLSIAEICAQHTLRSDPTLNSLQRMGATLLECSSWQHTIGSVWLPDALTQVEHSNNRTQAEQILSRYSTNSGTAYGSTEREAITHGVLEIIERHFVSELFFAELFGKEISGLKKIKEDIVHSRERNSYLISNYMGVSVAVCIEVDKAQNLLPIISSGASLDPLHAFERASTEFKQISVVSNEETEQEDLSAISYLKSIPGLEKLISPSPTAKEVIPIPKQSSQSFDNQWRTLTSIMQTLELCTRSLYKGPSNQSVVQVYSPKLSRFNLIRNGQMVAPLHFEIS